MQPVAQLEEYRTARAHMAAAAAAVATTPRRGRRAAERRKMEEGVDLSHTMRQDLPRLSPCMRSLAAYCLTHQDGLHRMRIQELAERTGNTPSTVVRFAKRYGYAGFLDFKFAFLHPSAPVDAPREAVAFASTEPLAAVWELERAAHCARALVGVVRGPAFRQSVDWLAAARSIAILARSEADRPIALHLQSRLERLQRKAVLLHGAQYLQEGCAEAVDVLLDIDLSGAAPSLYWHPQPSEKPLQFIRMTGARTSAFTSNVMAYLSLDCTDATPDQCAVGGLMLAHALCASLEN